MHTVYTIGHSNHSIGHFVQLLQQHHIATVADVRSKPVSRRFPHFSQQWLQEHLKSVGVDYVFMGGELGGRPEDPSLYDQKGNVDYARIAALPSYASAIERLLEYATKTQTAILCSEEDPNNCHRRHLITPTLVDRASTVFHIRGDGRIEPEEELRHGLLL